MNALKVCVPDMTSTVLIIENEPFVLDAMAEILATIGLKSIGVYDGLSGVDIYKKRATEIDVVILDMNLPGMAGPEVYKNIHLVNPGVKVIVSSGFDESDVKAMFGEYQPMTILKKPFNAQMLLDHVNCALSA
ncbi:MAG: hypothetical protein CSB13_11655 [Chloroflexi bacterium]|nr:MAG: hypothetical protein CSB13_11655 [Chloroflexota bacterium]